MKIATLQLASRLGERDYNISRADTLLASTNLDHVDLLVLPEMAFSGYAFPDLTSISALLEPTSAGPSTTWAIRTAAQLRCHVSVGYPERCTDPGHEGKNYNSLVTISPTGQVVAHYRKTFLYYTDETWAAEGPGFLFTEIAGFGDFSKVAMGICMDINPCQFKTEWEKYEFATHCDQTGAGLVVLSTAWLTSLSPEELTDSPMEPDLDTVNYWLARMKPLLSRMGRKEVVLVFANRSGIEPGQVAGVTRGVDANGHSVVGYAGTSCVMGAKDGVVKIWDMLGRAQEAVVVVDTDNNPLYKVQQNRGDSGA